MSAVIPNLLCLATRSRPSVGRAGNPGRLALLTARVKQQQYTAPHVRNQLERTTVRHLHGTTAATSQLSEMQTGNRPTLVKQQVYDGVRVYEDAIILGVHTLFDKTLDPNVVLHKDSIRLQSDITGIDDVEKYFRDNWFERYVYDHWPIEAAANADESFAFSLSVDQNVRKKPVWKYPDYKPVNIARVTKLIFNKEGMISDIYFLRQLTPDEQDEVLGDERLATLNDLDVDPMWLRREFMKQEPPLADESRLRKVQQGAKTFSDVWNSKDVSVLEGLLHPDVLVINMLFGKKEAGRAAMIDRYRAMLKGWEEDSSVADVAVTPDGLKAFIHWSNRGKEKSSGEPNNLKGYNILKYDGEGLITTVLAWRQPLASERKTLMKEG